MEPEIPATHVVTKAADLRVTVPQDVHLHICLEQMPESVSTLLDRLGKPASQSRLRGFVKDYLPALTPIATALFTGLVAFYGVRFNDKLTQDTLDKIANEFVEKQGKDPGVAAIKLAAYGEKALPAVRMVLASDNNQLREGGELIAQQMYLGRVGPQKMISEMMDDYNNPVLRVGVIEWFGKMGAHLEQPDREHFLARITDLKHGLGSQGENCVGQDENVTFAIANVLLAWSPSPSQDLADRSRDLALGLFGNCKDSQNPNKYDPTRKAAVSALRVMATSFGPKEKACLAQQISERSSGASPGLVAVIGNTVTELGKGAPKQ